MGLFDSVMFQCPACHAELEAQTKAGECAMERIDPERVSLAVAESLVDEELICRCGMFYRIVIDPPIPQAVQLVLEAIEPETTETLWYARDGQVYQVHGLRDDERTDGEWYWIIEESRRMQVYEDGQFMPHQLYRDEQDAIRHELQRTEGYLKHLRILSERHQHLVARMETLERQSA